MDDFAALRLALSVAPKKSGLLRRLERHAPVLFFRLMQTIQIQNVKIGRDAPLAIIAGPCQAESYDLCVEIGSAVQEKCAKLGFGYIFKASFDKANRSSIHTPRGARFEGRLGIARAREEDLGRADHHRHP